MSTGDRKCAKKGCSKLGKHLCSGCGEEIYCSKECQKDHWAAHKIACKTAIKPEAVALLKSLDELSIKQLKNIMKAKAASFEGKKKGIILTKLDKIVEKPSLVKFVEEYVTLSEVEALLSVPVSDSGAGVSSSSGSGKSSVKAKKAPSMNNQPMPTPKQMRDQARMMRQQPDAVRRANAMFASMTDEQIRQYADQIEQAAADPAMMQEMAKMAKMTPKDRTQLQHIQEGLSGAKPLDAAWIEATVQALKTNPKVFKSMLKGKGAMMGGLTDEQTDSFIDTVSSMDAYWLQLILRFLVFLGSLYRPALDLYAQVDAYTFGSARYLVLFVVMILAYYVSMVVWFVLKFVFGNLYLVYSFAARSLQGGASAAAGSSDAAATVFQAAAAVPVAGGSLASKVAAEGVAAATVAAGAAAAAVGAAGASASTGSNVAESADDEF